MIYALITEATQQPAPDINAIVAWCIAGVVLVLIGIGVTGADDM